MQGNIDIPLFSNSADDTHCVQAVLQMILKHYFPGRDYPFSYLDRVTYHRKGGWTWDTGMFVFLLNLGFEIIAIDHFDFHAFARKGVKYLQSIWQADEFEAQARNTDLTFEWLLVRDFMTTEKNIHIHNRKGTRDDIEHLFQTDYLVISNVNAYALDGQKGTCGHYVLITGIYHETLTFNDPGLPAIKNRRVTWRKFEKSRKENPSIFAVRK